MPLNHNLSETSYNDPDLPNYHLHDLLVLLQNARKETETAYKLLFQIRKHESTNLPEIVSEAQNQYLEWRSKKESLESLMEWKIGYCPTAITQKMLADIKKEDSKWQSKKAKKNHSTSNI